MKMKLLLFLTAVIVVFGGLIFKPWSYFQENRQIETTGLSCEAEAKKEENREVFQKTHYFSKEEATQLFGKEVRNLKCGKLKCPLRSNDCLYVQIDERGKVAGLKPRAGYDDYTLIIEWNEPKKVKDASLAEQGLDTYLTYLGKDNSYEILR